MLLRHLLAFEAVREAVVQVVQQWLCPGGKAQDPVAVHRPNVSAASMWCSSPREVPESYVGILKKQVLIPAKECPGSRRDELASENEREKAKDKSLLLL